MEKVIVITYYNVWILGINIYAHYLSIAKLNTAVKERINSY